MILIWLIVFIKKKSFYYAQKASDFQFGGNNCLALTYNNKENKANKANKMKLFSLGCFWWTKYNASPDTVCQENTFWIRVFWFVISVGCHAKNKQLLTKLFSESEEVSKRQGLSPSCQLLCQRSTSLGHEYWLKHCLVVNICSLMGPEQMQKSAMGFTSL